jgi:hypothetical protein
MPTIFHFRFRSAGRFSGMGTGLSEAMSVKVLIGPVGSSTPTYRFWNLMVPC